MAKQNRKTESSEQENLLRLTHAVLVNEITEYHNGKSRPESQLDMFTQADNLEVTK